MDNNGVGRVVGGIFIAICKALGREAAQPAIDALFRYSNDPEIPTEDRRIYRCIAECAAMTPEEAEAEYYGNNESSGTLRVISGGAA